MIIVWSIQRGRLLLLSDDILHTYTVPRREAALQSTCININTKNTNISDIICPDVLYYHANV